MVRVHVTGDLPIRPSAMPFADRIELRFGKAFPAVLVIDRDAVPRIQEALNEGWKALLASAAQQEGKR